MTISNLMKTDERSPNGKKTLQEKEKLLVTSNFSFSLSVFKRLVLQTRGNQGLFGKGLTLSQTTNFIDFSKWKEFADDNFEFDENGENFFKMVENTDICKTIYRKACINALPDDKF